jgi:hypothetical protein
VKGGSKDDLHRIVQADDLHIAPLREDGVTYGTPTWIWCVAGAGDLYVRGYYGRNSRWYQAAVQLRAGWITAAGSTMEVAFEPVDGPVNEAIDDVYWVKYRGSPLSQPHGQSTRTGRNGEGHAVRGPCPWCSLMAGVNLSWPAGQGSCRRACLRSCLPTARPVKNGVRVPVQAQAAAGETRDKAVEHSPSWTP